MTVAVERHTKRRTLVAFYAAGLRAGIRALSPRQLPTDDDHAVSTRVYQSDQPSQEPLDRH